MPRFAANLTLLFAELPYMERFAAAKAAGFDGVEVLFPYDCPVQEMRDKLVMNGLAFVLMNAPMPNYTGAAQGFAAIPGGEERFRRDFTRMLRYADVLKPTRIHLMAGVAEGAAAFNAFVANLTWACAQAPKRAFTIEPLNTADNPGYYLGSFDLAAEVLDAVGAPNLGLQFDTYHAQRITGDALACWVTHGARATHVQIGNAPERHEPGPGPIDFAAFFKQLDAEGYKGWVSAEYLPRSTTAAGLGWLPR